jgi:HD superfamily phosphohydrolase
VIIEDFLDAAVHEYHRIYSDHVRSYQYDIASREALRGAIEKVDTLRADMVRRIVARPLAKEDKAS